MQKQARLLVVASIFAASPASHAAGFLDALNAVTSIAGSAKPGQAAPQTQQTQLEAAADDIMKSLGLSAKTQQAKRDLVMQKLAALQAGQYIGIGASSGKDNAGGNPMALISGLASAANGNGGGSNPMAMLNGLAGGGNAPAAGGKLGQGLQIMEAVAGAQQAASSGGDSGGSPSMMAMALTTYAKSQGNSSTGKIAGFLAENPDVLNQLMELSSDASASPEKFSAALSKIARKQQAKGGKNSTAWQVASVMAENPELTRQVLSVAGKSTSLFSGLGNLFSSDKSEAADKKKSGDAASSEGGGFFGGLKGAFSKNSNEKSSAESSNSSNEPPSNPFGS